MWGAVQLRICGPSFSRKKRLSAVNDANTASDASVEIPVPMPRSSVWKASLTDLLASLPADCALLASTPASWSHFWALATAPWRAFSIWLDSLVTLDSSRTVISAASATTASSEIAAPPPRPSRCAASQETGGDSTAAMIDAVMTGVTIGAVSDKSQTIPPSRTKAPTSSHDINPTSRSHAGTAKIRDSSFASNSTNVTSGAGASVWPESFGERSRRNMRRWLNRSPRSRDGHWRGGGLGLERLDLVAVRAHDPP